MGDLQIRKVGEAQRLFSPLLGALNALVARIAWVLGVLAAIYLVSGVTSVRENEVALVQRFGRLVGDTRAEQVHGPGLLVALPFPIDRVTRVPTDLVREVSIESLDASDAMRRDDPFGEEQGDRIDIVREGYVVTGDRFVMQTRLVARYTVADPVAFAIEGTPQGRERLVHDAVQTAAVRMLTRNASRALIEDLPSLPRGVRDAAQARLDALDSGVELVEVSMGEVRYPRQVRKAVEDVADAQVEARQRVVEADSYRRSQREQVDYFLARALNEQRAYAQRVVARVEGSIDAYTRLAPQYAKAPDLVREMLLRDDLGQILRESGARLTYIDPPTGERYTDLRVTHSPSRAKDAAATEPGGDH